MAERNIGRPWSAQEDHLLINAVNQHGPGDNWKVIALAVPGRTNKACRKVRVTGCDEALQLDPMLTGRLLIALAALSFSVDQKDCLDGG